MKGESVLIHGLAKKVNKKDTILEKVDVIDNKIEIDEDYVPEKVERPTLYRQVATSDPFNHLPTKKYQIISVPDPFIHLHPKHYQPYKAIDNKEQKAIFGLPSDSKLKPMDNDLYYEYNLKGKTVKDIAFCSLLSITLYG